MSKKLRISVITLLATTILALSFSIGCTIGTNTNTSPTTSFSTTVNSNPSAAQSVVDQAWQVIQDNYVEKDKINSNNLTAGAIKGMMEALADPYSSYLSPQNYQMSQSDLTGQFQGIGAFVGIKEGKITIISPMPDSPAAKAGVLAGDTIMAVDGQSTTGMSLEETVLRIRGPEGTAVTLTILHVGKTGPEDIRIVRAAIEVPTVTLDMKGDIAYIRIYQFNERTDIELTKVLQDMQAKAPTGIILDLRSNPGGLVDTVVSVASHFIKKGVIIYLVDNQGGKTSQSVKPTSVTSDLPIVALSDNYSASGSEVLMGALQDYGRATIAGTTTFGKGSYDSFFPLKDGSGIYLTIGRWATPNGRLIEGSGIEPDVKLELHGDNMTQWAIDYLHSNKK